MDDYSNVRFWNISNNPRNLYKLKTTSTSNSTPLQLSSFDRRSRSESKNMNKISKFLFLMLFVSPLVSSEEFTYKCSEWTNTAGANFHGKSIKDFTKIYKVNTLTKTIIHTSSIVDDSKDGIYKTREIIVEKKVKEKIVFWEYPKTVFTYTREEIYFMNPYTLLFDFEKGTMLQSSNTGLGSLRDQIYFSCIKT